MSRTIVATRPLRAAQCRGVASNFPPTASTSAPCLMRYAHASSLPLTAAMCNGVMRSSSLSVAHARPDSIKARITSVLPCCEAAKMSSWIRFHTIVSFLPPLQIQRSHLSIARHLLGVVGPGRPRARRSGAKSTGSVENGGCYLVIYSHPFLHRDHSFCRRIDTVATVVVPWEQNQGK